MSTTLPERARTAPHAAELAAIRRSRAAARTRRIGLGTVLGAAVVVVFAASLSVGEAAIPLPDVLSTLAGQGSRSSRMT